MSYNGESVLLVSKQNDRNLVAGETLNRDISISWFGEGTLQGATLNWSLTGVDGTVLANGQQAVSPVEAGTVRRIAAIRLPTPKLVRPKKTTLTVDLAYSDKRLKNQWDYWLFPSGWRIGCGQECAYGQ